MSEVIDSLEEIEAHKLHEKHPCPETCDLCWMDAPFTAEELKSFNDSESVPWD